MLTIRIAAAALLALPCLAQPEKGAKALFVDATSGVTLQSSGQPAPVARKTNPSTPVPAAAAPTVTEMPGLKYWFELQTLQGEILRVNASRTFRSGERIRLHLESKLEGDLVIFQSQDNGPLARLYPGGAGSGRIERFKDQVFPSRSGWFRFDSKPGDLRLMVMVQPDKSRQGEASETELARRVTSEAERLRGSKALIVEDDNSATEAASYVVVDQKKDSRADSGMVAIEIRLAHR